MEEMNVFDCLRWAPLVVSKFELVTTFIHIKMKIITSMKIEIDEIISMCAWFKKLSHSNQQWDW